jgi:hypothetical protein
MCKKALRVEQMSPSAFVDHAAEMNRDLVNRECRGPGDLENAMRRVEQKWGVPVSIQWALRYRKPKSIAADVFARIAFGWEASREQQLKRLQHEQSITEAKGWLASHFARAAASLVSPQDK